MARPTTPEGILAAMAQVYGRCQSYRDTGTLTNHFTRADGQVSHTDAKLFRTVFVRPDRFRFEVRRRVPALRFWQFVVWANGDEILHWESFGRGRVTSAESVQELLMNLGGVSTRVSWVVPFFLIPGWANGASWGLTGLERLEDGPTSGVDCYRLRGRFPVTPGHDEECRRDPNEGRVTEEGPATFWVEKERFLLRRFENTLRAPGLFWAETEAVYDPEIDIAIPDEELARGFE